LFRFISSSYLFTILFSLLMLFIFKNILFLLSYFLLTFIKSFILALLSNPTNCFFICSMCLFNFLFLLFLLKDLLSFCSFHFAGLVIFKSFNSWFWFIFLINSILLLLDAFISIYLCYPLFLWFFILMLYLQWSFTARLFLISIHLSPFDCFILTSTCYP
jgi:hypothetical protein